MTIATVCPGCAKVSIHQGTGYIMRTPAGTWQGRPEWDAFTNGKHFPTFRTRREAAEWLWETYGTAN